MRIFMRLAFQMVSCVLIVVGRGPHTVFKTDKTCCVAEVASVTLG